MSEFKEGAKRKPNFQGPLITINISSLEWQPFVGDLDGFSTSDSAPQLGSAGDDTDGTMEAKNMAGTDESV